MARTGTGFRITQIVHGAVQLAGPAGGGFAERAGHEALRACVAPGPLGLACTQTGLTAEVRVTDLDDTIAPGTKATLAITLKDAAGGTAVVSAAGMKRGDCRWEFARAPFTRVIRFEHEGAMTSSPIAVSV